LQFLDGFPESVNLFIEPSNWRLTTIQKDLNRLAAQFPEYLAQFQSKTRWVRMWVVDFDKNPDTTFPFQTVCQDAGDMVSFRTNISLGKRHFLSLAKQEERLSCILD